MGGMSLAAPSLPPSAPNPAPQLTPPAPSRLTANLLCSLSMFSWAAGLPAADVLIPLVPALPLTAARMGLAGVVLLIVWLMIEGPRAVQAAPWLRATGIGAMLGVGGWLLILGQARTDAVTVAIISAALPLVGIALEVAFDGRRLRPSLVLGVALSLLGGVLALSGKGLGVDLGLGAALCLASVVLYTLGSRLSVTALPDLTPLGRTAATVAGAGLTVTLLATIAGQLGAAATDWAALGPRDWVALMIFALFSMAVSQILWVASVGSLGIGLAALHINAAPFYVMLIALAFGGSWNGMQALGALVVVLGVILAQDLWPGLWRGPKRGQ